MTKVKCDVQIIVTGAAGSGKSQIATRILKAIELDSALGKIAKCLPEQSIEGYVREQFTIRFSGDLDLGKKGLPRGQGTEVAPGVYAFQFPNGTNVYVWKPDGVDAFKGASYAIDVAMAEKKEYDETKGPYACRESKQTEKPIQIHFQHDMEDGWYIAKLPDSNICYRSESWLKLKDLCVDAVPNTTFEWSADNDKQYQLYCPKELQKAPGEEQGDKTVTVNIFNKAPEYNATTVYVSQSGVLSLKPRVHTDEPKVTMLIASHIDATADPVGSPAQSENDAASHAATPSAHGKTAALLLGDQVSAIMRDEGQAFDPAKRTLGLLNEQFAKQFVKHGQVEGSVLKGDFWVIFSDGALVPLTDHMFLSANALIKPIYYAERFEQDAASPVKDAHITDDPLHNVMLQLGTFPPTIVEQFKANVGEFPVAISPKCLVQVLFKDGTVGQRLAGDCNWSLKDFNAVIFYRPI